MKTRPRESVWILLSELFVDAERTNDELLAIAGSLQETGFSVDEVEAILHREVAPVCGRWMTYPGAIGPWPMFDAQDLRERIEAHLRKPWYKPPLFRAGLGPMPGVERDWAILRDAMRGNPDA